jgi:branched-chain amino acid transport system substrate-binding protein
MIESWRTGHAISVGFQPRAKMIWERVLMRFQFTPLVLGVALIASTANGASGERNDRPEVARALATRFGQALGAAKACQDVDPPRLETMNNKFRTVLKSKSTADEINVNTKLFDRSAAEGQRAVESGRKECTVAVRELTELEKSVAASKSSATAAKKPPPRTQPAPLAAPASPTSGAAPTAAAALAPAAPIAHAAPPAGKSAAEIRGVSDKEIRFGISAPFSGSTKELGHQMKLGIEAAFNEANANGGIHGRRLKLITADDGYEPARTAETMKQLVDTHQVFGVIGNVGTPTATVALPFALDRKMLFYAPFTGADLLRHVPPDRYVFNFRASYAEETEAVVQYLLKVRGLRPEQIAVFAQHDAFGDAGFAGVAKAMRALRGGNEGSVLRLNYERNTVDVEDAIARLRESRVPIKAIVMVATYRAAAKLIEKTRDAHPDLIYTNVSFVGSTALAQELLLLGRKYADGVIVTQVVPSVEGSSSVSLEYKAALAAYAPGEAPDYVSLEGYLAARVLVKALKRAGPQLDTEKVVEALESLRDYELALGAPLIFSRTEHQGLHKVWGSQLDANGRYQPIELQ